MNKREAAALIRKAFRREGFDPKGRVYSRRSDYYNELVVELRYLDEEARDYVEFVINEIPRDIDFSFEIE
jgi:hypothetical protein